MIPTTTPGYYQDSMSQYLSDPLPEPSLSTGVVVNLIDRTPMHAHLEHPRLGKRSNDSSPRGDLGSAIHSAILGGPEIEYVGLVTKRSGKDKGEAFLATDWATQDAKDARDRIRSEGKIPMLEHQREVIQKATESAARLLASLGKGKAETSMYFQVNGVWCRGRSDWLTDDGRYDVDVKTVDSADPYLFARRQLHQNNYDIQMALRGLGHEALQPNTDQQPKREGVFLLVEIEPPYAASFVGLGPTARELAERKIKHACNIWRECLNANEFPGYSRKIVWAEAASFAAFDVEERSIP